MNTQHVNMTDADISCEAADMEQPKEPKDRLRLARKAAGFDSASAAADHLKVKLSTYRAHENGQNKFTYSDAKKYADGFGTNAAWLIGAADYDLEHILPKDAEMLKLASPANMVPSAPKSPFIAPPARLDMPRDVPVYGFAVGGGDDDGEFYMNGQIADYVRRPPGISNMRGVFGIYVVGESMCPRFQPGELVFATSAQAPGIGDDVVIELVALNLETDDNADHSARGLIKRLKRRGPNKVIVEQFNPARDLEFDRTEIKAIHKVLTNNDLFGA